jgi:hypothetical protein
MPSRIDEIRKEVEELQERFHQARALLSLAQGLEDGHPSYGLRIFRPKKGAPWRAYYGDGPLFVEGATPLEAVAKLLAQAEEGGAP